MPERVTVELVWPGIVTALSLAMIFVVLPIILIVSLIRWCNLSWQAKVFLSLLALIAPFVLCCIIPWGLRFSGLFSKGCYGFIQPLSYRDMWVIFGRYTAEIYSAITSLLVIKFCRSIYRGHCARLAALRIKSENKQQHENKTVPNDDGKILNHPDVDWYVS